MTCICDVYLSVALNFQTGGEEMQLLHGRFLDNGNSGYVLKPQCLRTGIEPQTFGNIRIYHECEGEIEKPIPTITIQHHESCRVGIMSLVEWASRVLSSNGKG